MSTNLSLKAVSKTIFNCIAFLSAVFFSTAQTNTSNGVDLRSQCLFEKFAKGVVLMKNGSVEDASLNYNTADQSIVFEKDENTIMTLTGLESVDTIYFNHKKFIPGPDGLIYEVVINNSPRISLFVTYTNKLRSAATGVDQSGTSRKEAGEVSNTMTGVYVLRPFKGDYIVEIQKSYWLIKAKQVYKAGSEKQFAKVFPHQDEAIQKFVADQQTNFRLEDDLIKLTLFCNSRL
jgi:hypothetical protein